MHKTIARFNMAEVTKEFGLTLGTLWFVAKRQEVSPETDASLTYHKILTVTALAERLGLDMSAVHRIADEQCSMFLLSYTGDVPVGPRAV